MNEVKKRKKAIELFLKGEQITRICNNFQKSRKWFYKWKKRYTLNPKGAWYIDQSRVPKKVPKRYSSKLEQEVVSARKKLDMDKYAQNGALSIHYELYNQGKQPPPIWTINRILKSQGLIKKKKKGYQSKNLPYPGRKYFSVQQMDLVGPRYIKDYGRVYSLNIIDIETHYVHVNPLPGKSAEHVVNAVMRFWKQYGFPDYLQMDNELSFRGSNRHPRSYGKLVRFALYHNVGIIFIPQAEPWRNGIIEKFNDKFDKLFYRKNEFKGLDDMKKKLMNLKNITMRITGIQQITAKPQQNNEDTLEKALSLNRIINYLIGFYSKRERLCLFDSLGVI